MCACIETGVALCLCVCIETGIVSQCVFVADPGRGSRSVCGEDVETAGVRNRSQEAGTGQVMSDPCQTRCLLCCLFHGLADTKH